MKWQWIRWFLFSIRGRVNRKPFIIFSVVVTLAYIVMEFTLKYHRLKLEDFIHIANIVFAVIFIWPSLAVESKRWHDLDKSAWWIFIKFIPIVGPIYALFKTVFIPGTDGSNRFGEDPIPGVTKSHVIKNRKLTAQEIKILLVLGIIFMLLALGYPLYMIFTER